MINLKLRKMYDILNQKHSSPMRGYLFSLSNMYCKAGILEENSEDVARGAGVQTGFHLSLFIFSGKK